MGNYGIKISNSGSNINSSELNDYIYHSGYSLLKTYIVTNISYTFRSDLSTVSITITHNLGFYAMVWSSIDGSPTDAHTLGTWIGTSGSGHRFWETQNSTNNFHFEYFETVGASHNPTGETWDFKYYLFYEHAEP